MQRGTEIFHVRLNISWTLSGHFRAASSRATEEGRAEFSDSAQIDSHGSQADQLGLRRFQSAAVGGCSRLTCWVHHGIIEHRKECLDGQSVSVHRADCGRGGHGAVRLLSGEEERQHHEVVRQHDPTKGTCKWSRPKEDSRRNVWTIFGYFCL